MNTTNTTLARQQFDAALLELKKSLPKGIQVEVYWSKGMPIVSYRVRYMRMGKRHDLGTFYVKDEALRALAEHKVYGTVRQILTPAQQANQIETDSLVAQRAAELGEEALMQGKEGIKQENISNNDQWAIDVMTAALEILPPHMFTGEDNVDFYWEAKDQVISITPAMMRIYFHRIEIEAKKELLKERQAAMLRGPESRSDSQESPEPTNSSSTSSEDEQPELSDEEYNKLLGLDD